jgi:hypothetical protein
MQLEQRAQTFAHEALVINQQDTNFLGVRHWPSVRHAPRRAGRSG